jgi:uncharacterized protein (DUF488 family)
MLIHTVGHSTRTIEAFVEILHTAEVTLLVDIRSVPRSRRVPHFNTEALEVTLPQYAIRYAREPRLGGFRRFKAESSANIGWHHESFRAYADYMQTAPFRTAIQDLMRVAIMDRIALMCAEAVPWRCHRKLVADALTVRGVEVHDLMGGDRWQLHRLTSFAHAEGSELTYPADASLSQ